MNVSTSAVWTFPHFCPSDKAGIITVQRYSSMGWRMVRPPAALSIPLCTSYSRAQKMRAGAKFAPAKACKQTSATFDAVICLALLGLTKKTHTPVSASPAPSVAIKRFVLDLDPGSAIFSKEHLICMHIHIYVCVCTYAALQAALVSSS